MVSSSSSPSSTVATRRWGWWPRSSRQGELPGGMPAVAVRGVERARLGTAVPGTGQALWVEVEALRRGARPPTRRRAGPRVPGRGREHPARAAVPAGWPNGWRDVTEPGRMADMAGYSPDLTLAQKVEVLETLDVEAPAAAGHRLGPRGPGRPDPPRADQDRRRGGHGEDPARVPAAAPAGVHPQGAGPAGRRRRGRARRLPRQGGRARPARGRAQGGRARDRQARADERTEPRARVDPHLAGHRARAARGASSPTTGSTSPRRRASSTRTTTAWTT